MPTIDTSKYLPPSLPKIVHRDRLIDRLRSNRDKRIILIVGQAAQGKSTLTAAYLNSLDVPSAWVHLDETDSDHANFYYLLVRSLQHAHPDNDFSNFLKSHQFTLGAREETGRLRERIRHLLARVSSPAHIVLDGIEKLAADASSLKLIETLMESVPPGANLFLISREMPPLKLQRFKMNQELLLLTNDALAFTEDEIDTFFRVHQEIRLPPDQVRRLLKITGGWVGGLILFSEGLNRLPAQDRTHSLEQEMTGDLRQETFSYFSEEIFSAQGEPVQSFLVTSSILDVIDPAIMNDLTGRRDAAVFLSELARRNLFIHTIRARGEQETFRYNRLFRDFLESKFRATLDRARQKELLEKAGDQYWAQGAIEDAIRYYLRAEAFDVAADGIKKIAMDLAIRGRFRDLANWIDSLPRKQVQEDPWMSFFLALTRRISGGNRNIDDFHLCVERFRSIDDLRGQILSLAYLIEAAVFVGHDPAALKTWIKNGETMLQTLSDTRYFAYAKAVLWLQIGFGHISDAGDLQKGLSACQNAYLLALKIGDLNLQANAMIISVLGLAWAGDFIEADRSLSRIRQLAGTSLYPEYRSLQNIVNIQLALNRGDFSKAREYLEAAREDIEAFGLLFLYPAFIDASGLLEIYEGNFAEAEKIGRHLSDVAVLSSSIYFGGLARRLSAMIDYFRGNFEAAGRDCLRAKEILSEGNPLSIHLFRVKIMAGLVFIHRGALSRAEKELKDALSYFSKVSSLLSVAETHLALALMYHADGNLSAAARELGAGFQIAAERHYAHFIVMRPADLARACILAVDLEVKPAKDFAARLLSTRLADIGAAELEAMSGQKAPEDRRNGLEVRRAIYRSQLPRLAVRTLGGFEVFRDGKSPIPDKQWAGNRPKLLMKAIVVHGAREIPKDILIDDLWPESDRASALKKFKVTLHRLRRVFEPNPDRAVGSAYLHLKDNLVSLDRELCSVDVEEFLAISKKLKQVETEEDPGQTLRLCRQAAALYGGDFLPEDPYAPWADMKRAALRENYIGVLSKMVDIYEAEKMLTEATDCCRSILDADPFHESACRRLMSLYSSQGMQPAALKLYEDFKIALEADIGVAPDPSTTAMYRSILKAAPSSH